MDEFAATLAAALTSGLLWPTVGVLLVAIGLLLDRYRTGVRIGEQLATLWASSRRPLTLGLTTTGVSLVSSLATGRPTPLEAVAGGVTVFLVMVGARPLGLVPPPPATPITVRPGSRE